MTEKKTVAMAEHGVEGRPPPVDDTREDAAEDFSAEGTAEGTAEATTSGLFAGLSIAPTKSSHEDGKPGPDPSPHAAATPVIRNCAAGGGDAEAVAAAVALPDLSVPPSSDADEVSGDADTRLPPASAPPSTRAAGPTPSGPEAAAPPLSPSASSAPGGRGEPPSPSAAVPTDPGIIPRSGPPLTNPDACLRLLRKFLTKAGPSLPETFGGTRAQGWMSYLFGSSTAEDGGVSGSDPASGRAVLEAYRSLADAVGTEDGGASPTSPRGEIVGGAPGEADLVVASVLGAGGDTLGQSRAGLAAFVHLLAAWCRASPEVVPASEPGPASLRFARCGRVEPKLLSLAIDAAQSLVAHGCLDGITIEFGHGNGSLDSDDDDSASAASGPVVSRKVIDVLTEAVLFADLSSEGTELSALKFLLTTGCRTEGGGPAGEAMLRGSSLLQTVRVCYHVYLKTGSLPNKTTAKAALRQLVSSVFTRMQMRNDEMAANAADAEGGSEEEKTDPASSRLRAASAASAASVTTSTLASGGEFVSPDHRDAFLVLRSLCKLSMRQAQPGASFDDGFVAGDGQKAIPGGGGGGGGDAVGTAATNGFNPAFDSKILALELLLYLMSHTSTPSMLSSGPQFAYAVRHYLCVSLLKNCTSANTTVVNLSLRLFVPLIRHYRSYLKTEIEAFVTNVFFVILDSENSTVEHKSLVVTLFEEICSDPTTLAEIFLNYDCDLSAVDLFQRIVNTLARVARIGLAEESSASSVMFVAGAGAAHAERSRQEYRELRLVAMKAVRRVLQSLHGSIVTPIGGPDKPAGDDIGEDEGFMDTNSGETSLGGHRPSPSSGELASPSNGPARSPTKSSTIVQAFDSKKRRKEEEARVILKFDQKPSAGIKLAGDYGHVDAADPVDVAQYLLKMKDDFEKTQIGEYLGREPEYQGGFALKVLHAYVDQLRFEGLAFDDAIRFYLSGFRLPGEAQKIDRIMEKFAERFSLQNPTVFPNADVAFILAFSIIMLNTDLHNPAIKEERRMTKQGFIRNNRGISDGGDLPEEFLTAIFDRIKTNPISLKEDDEARDKQAETQEVSSMLSPAAINPSLFFSNHYIEMDRERETNFQKERDQIVRNTESLLKRKKKHQHSGKKAVASGGGASPKSAIKFVSTGDSGLRDEFVSPMFEVTWAPALAVFSTVMESANGTVGRLADIASEEEMDAASKNASEAVEVCLSSFQLAICTAGLCENETARSAFVHALLNFSLLGTGRLIEHRHVRCVQILLALGRDDGELLGNGWEHIFLAISEIARLRKLSEFLSKNKRRENDDSTIESGESDESASSTESFNEEAEMDKRAIDERNASVISTAVSEELTDVIFHRSIALSVLAFKDFIFQLCRVSRMEIAGYGGHVGSKSNAVDLTAVHYRQQHTLLTNKGDEARGHYNQPDIYSLQKLVEVSHYNMDSRARLVFADIWTTVSAHLTSTALHSNVAVATYAVDSFRQLGTQFLQREELAVYGFQRKFLKPLEGVMARCEHSSVKELLLKCIEQIILMFGSKKRDDNNAEENEGHSILRSGWKPVIKVIGLTGRDADDGIAETGFNMLTTQVNRCLDESKSLTPVVLRAEHFVDLLEALLMFVSGPREEKSLLAIDQVVALSDFIASDKTPLPISSRAKSSSSSSTENSGQELGLWWPILLGLSGAVGDTRRSIRTKSLVTLHSIINSHFFPHKEESDAASHGEYLQTLQLIFRGILTPILEHAETSGSSEDRDPIPSPDNFEHFITDPSSSWVDVKESDETPEKTSWLDTTFDHLIDACISLCLKSIDIYHSDAIVEEVLGMFNNCLISDSGALAVRGVTRLHKFIVEDLDMSSIADDTWATVCHMLRGCLSVRGLPTLMPSPGEEESESKVEDGDSAAEAKSRKQQEMLTRMNEFILEEDLLADRRYIGSNAIMIVGSLLSRREIINNMGLRWYVFLCTGLGRGIEEWEQAAEIMAMYPHQSVTTDAKSAPPNYLENSLYGRKWMVTFMICLIGKDEVLNPEKASDGKPSAVAAKNLIKEQSEALMISLLKKESARGRAVGAIPDECRETDLKRTTELICDLLDALTKLDDSLLFSLAKLTPTFSACMKSKSEKVRDRVHGLVHRMFEGPLADRLKGEKAKPPSPKKDEVSVADEPPKEEVPVADEESDS